MKRMRELRYGVTVTSCRQSELNGSSDVLSIDVFLILYLGFQFLFILLGDSR